MLTSPSGFAMLQYGGALGQQEDKDCYPLDWLAVLSRGTSLLPTVPMVITPLHDYRHSEQIDDGRR